MNVTIIGTGNMARGIGTRVLAGGHDLTVLGKSAADADAVASDLRGANAGAAVQTGESARDPIEGDVVVLAVYYPDARSFVEARADDLAGKTVVDITNPLNESYDGLVTPPDGSAAQELARLAPEAKFVKAFNTTFAKTLSEGEVAGQPLDVLVAADDAKAKGLVLRLAEGGFLRPIDVGPLDRARELEALGLLHMTLQGTLGTGFASAVKFLS